LTLECAGLLEPKGLALGLQKYAFNAENVVSGGAIFISYQTLSIELFLILLQRNNPTILRQKRS